MTTGPADPPSTAAALLAGIPVLAFVVPLLLGLLTPGRKGRMTTQKTVFHPGVDEESALAAYAGRLQFEGFRILRASGNGSLLARRPQPFAHSGVSMAHADKPYEAELRLTPRDGGVEARLKLWTTDWVIVDTGEGRYIDELLARIVGADLINDPAPLVPNSSFLCNYALHYGVYVFLAAGAISWAPAALDWVPTDLETRRMWGLLAIHGAISLPLAALAALDASRRGLEITGARRAGAGAVMGAIGGLIALVQVL